MSGKMRKRKSALPRHARETYGMAKSFHAPQKDNSRRQKKKARLNDYEDQSHQAEPTSEPADTTPNPEPKRRRRLGRRK